jgi:hypothetical protein
MRTEKRGGTMKRTKKAFREELNRLFPFNPDQNNRHGNGNYYQTKRPYGDYLYSQDKVMFDLEYERWLKDGAGQ